jgi:hypothetical protein
MASNFPDTQPPALNPATGAIWTSGDNWIDPATNIVYVWTPPVWKTDYTPNAQADAKYVEVAGDNMTGDLTLSADKIRLYAANGNAEFAGEIKAQGNSSSGGTIRVSNARTSKKSAFIVEGLIEPDNSVGTNKPKAVFTNKGDLTLGTDASSDPKIFLAYDGSATFASSRFNIDSDGGAAVVYQGADDATPCLDLYVPNGAATTPFIRATNGLAEVASINADGSAEFAGLVNVGDTGADPEGHTLYTNGALYSRRSGNSNAVYRAFTSGNPNYTIEFKNDGSAEFAGDITANNVSFNLEADNAAHYTTTTDSEGNETQVYNGPTLDVKEKLQEALATIADLQTRIAALEAA